LSEVREPQLPEVAAAKREGLHFWSDEDPALAVWKLQCAVFCVERADSIFGIRSLQAMRQV
jgi:hypothetical protein